MRRHLMVNDIEFIGQVFLSCDLPLMMLSGLWRMRRAGSRRPWRRRPLPNCLCPSPAECPGTAQPRLLATPVVTWRPRSHPPSPPPPLSAAAHPQVWQVCVRVEMWDWKEDWLSVWSEWRCWMQMDPTGCNRKKYSHGYAIRSKSIKLLWRTNEQTRIFVTLTECSFIYTQ